MNMQIITKAQFEHPKATTETDTNQKIDQTVLDIIHKVRQNGDQALFQYTEKFDGIQLEELRVSEAEINEAQSIVSPTFMEAIKKAQQNITEFHEAQQEKSWYIRRDAGVTLGQQVRPLDRVGIYIPGGKAAYPSTVLMNAIPAKIAGVQDVAITTPPQTDGTVNPHVLVAASLAGIDRIYKIGGAQAIAALAYGTETIPKVDKIVGPGNAFVARAKKWVFGDVAIDMIAGPSEICVVADETAPVRFVAADLLSQAEHDEDATAICITFSKQMAKGIQVEVDQQLNQLDRTDIATASIQKNGKIIVVDTLDDAFELVNDIAPEHLQLMIQNASDHTASVKHAGAIFLGNYSPEPLGDYMAGPNHTLPTSGTAKFASPLGVYDFLKKSSIIHYSENALQQEANYIQTIANMEELTGHSNAIKVRFSPE